VPEPAVVLVAVARADVFAAEAAVAEGLGGAVFDAAADGACVAALDDAAGDGETETEAVGAAVVRAPGVRAYIATSDVPTTAAMAATASSGFAARWPVQ